MMSSRVLQLLFLLSSMTPQVIGMTPQEISPKPPKGISSLLFQIEGIAQKVAELPKELQYKIFSSALALRENPKYEVYKKFYVGSEVFGIVLNEDNTRALIGSDDGVACLWDIEKGTVIKELKGHSNVITSMALSADGRIALTGSWGGRVGIWNTLTGELLQTIQVGSLVTSVALSADGTSALTGGQGGIVRLYTSTGELTKELKGHRSDISSVALSADGTIALTGDCHGMARLWNTDTGELLQTLQAGSRVTSVAISADGTIAVTLNRDSKILVWDAKSGALLNTLLTRNFGFIFSVALSKDGRRVLTGTTGKIQLWNTKPLPGQKVTDKPLTVLEDHTTIPTAVAFGSDDFIASGSNGGSALIWKTFALESQDLQENKEIFRQAYKETFSRPLLRPTNGS